MIGESQNGTRNTSGTVFIFMKILIKGAIIIWVLTGQGMVHADQIQSIFMPESENKEVIYIDKKTGMERSRWAISLTKKTIDQATIYITSSTGKGDYDIYEDVAWEARSEMEERKGLLYPLYSVVVIKDLKGRIIVTHEKHFDYDKRKIVCFESDTKGNVIDKATFPIKGLTADSASLTYILKPFVAHRDDRKYKDLYLLSERKRLYHLTISTMGKELLDLPGGKIEAIKLRLIPNLGPLTSIIGSLIPPTFVWYTDSPYYEWLQYEGLETGIGSTYITVYLEKKLYH